jgi:hypothetical protein
MTTDLGDPPLIRKGQWRIWHRELTFGFKRERNTPESVKSPFSPFVPRNLNHSGKDERLWFRRAAGETVLPS